MKLPANMTATVTGTVGVNLAALLAGAAGPPAADVSEADFQARVIDLAEAGGWKWFHVHDSRRSPAGFTDLVLVKPARAVIFAELKKRTGKTSKKQDEWLAALRGALGTRVFVWRPADLPEIARILGE